MTPEIYAIGFSLAAISALLGIIWKQLNSRLDKKDETDAVHFAELKRESADEVAKLEIRLSSRLHERMLDHSSRLSNGSLRMDAMQTEVSNLKVKLAEEYHSAVETRTLIQDMMLPVTQQLNRMETDLRFLANQKRSE
jgi:hypothetical protein